MSALGDPLVDLGILLAYWVPSAPPASSDALDDGDEPPGWFTRDEVVERYADAQRPRSVDAALTSKCSRCSRSRWCIQQIYYRFVKGQTDDPRFATFGERVSYLAQRATELAR